MTARREREEREQAELLAEQEQEAEEERQEAARRADAAARKASRAAAQATERAVDAVAEGTREVAAGTQRVTARAIEATGEAAGRCGRPGVGRTEHRHVLLGHDDGDDPTQSRPGHPWGERFRSEHRSRHPGTRR